MTAPAVSIIEAMDSPEIWGPWFRNPDDWKSWRTFLMALFGLPMSEAELAFYHTCTGRSAPPDGGFTEAWLIIGRRGGKSFILALVAVYLAAFRDWSEYLVPGERATVKVVAADRRQARAIFSYARSLITEVPLLSGLLESDSDDELVLSNGITIEIATASFRTIRGATVIAGLLDEVAFLRSDETSANPDTEILRALRPGMVTIPGAMLLAASSPYAKRGELWKAFKRWFGKDDARPLVWQAATRVMHSSVPQSDIDEEYERDPESAAAEFGAQFRNDISGFLDRELIELAIDQGIAVRPPRPGLRYFAFTDPSGGRGDFFTAAISHAEGDVMILDCLLERRAPFNPSEVVSEIAALLRSYGIKEITGDKYAAEWVVEAFTKQRVKYNSSDRDRSSIYLDALPLFTTGRARLVDNQRLMHQFAGLERRTSRVGRDLVDHPPNGSDDCANSAAGALVLAASSKGGPVVFSDAVLSRLRSLTPTPSRQSGQYQPCIGPDGRIIPKMW